MLMGPQNLPERVRIVRNRISSAAAAALRNVDSVTLLAVSKAPPANKVRAVAQLGVQDFGERYVQEGLDKIEDLRDLSLTCHLTGRLQGDKTGTAAASIADDPL